MATFHKITWQEFEKIKQTLSSYNEMNLQVSEEQKNQLLQILQKCQNKQKIQKIQINELEQNEMIANPEKFYATLLRKTTVVPLINLVRHLLEGGAS